MERRKVAGDWRFFTRLKRIDDAVADVWCWARVDYQENVIQLVSGFPTIVAAMHDAREHGYSGRVEPRGPDPTLQDPRERRVLEILAA